MAVLPLTLLDGTTAYASDVMSIFYPLYTDIAPNNVQALNKLGVGRFVLESALTAGTTGTNPIGTHIWHFDYGIPALIPDTSVWKIMDGSVIADGASPLNGQTVADLSGRYLVGFGTDGGGNIGAGALPVPPTAVGNAGHTINIQHSHTVNSHTHGPGTLQFQTFQVDAAGIHPVEYTAYTSGGASTTVFTELGFTAGAVNAMVSNITPPTGGGSFYTKGGTGATGADSPGTNNQLSTTQSIQPRSVQARAYIRYK